MLSYVTYIHTNKMAQPIMIPGHRYTFCQKIPGEETYSTFRAKFLFISRRGESPTLHVDTIQGERVKTTKMTVPLNWIVHVETLESICGNRFTLPADVLYQIDDFI